MRYRGVIEGGRFVRGFPAVGWGLIKMGMTVFSK